MKLLDVAQRLRSKYCASIDHTQLKIGHQHPVCNTTPDVHRHSSMKYM